MNFGMRRLGDEVRVTSEALGIIAPGGARGANKAHQGAFRASRVGRGPLIREALE
jgi:hypothetical protein